MIPSILFLFKINNISIIISSSLLLLTTTTITYHLTHLQIYKLIDLSTILLNIIICLISCILWWNNINNINHILIIISILIVLIIIIIEFYSNIFYNLQTHIITHILGALSYIILALHNYIYN